MLEISFNSKYLKFHFMDAVKQNLVHEKYGKKLVDLCMEPADDR